MPFKKVSKLETIRLDASPPERNVKAGAFKTQMFMGFNGACRPPNEVGGILLNLKKNMKVIITATRKVPVNWPTGWQRPVAFLARLLEATAYQVVPVVIILEGKAITGFSEEKLQTELKHIDPELSIENIETIH